MLCVWLPPWPTSPLHHGFGGSGCTAPFRFLSSSFWVRGVLGDTLCQQFCDLLLKKPSPATPRLGGRFPLKKTSRRDRSWMWRDAERFLAKCLGPSELVGLRPYLQPLGRRTSLMELHGLSPTDANHSAPPRNNGRIVRLLIKCFKLGAMSVPEALETTLRILVLNTVPSRAGGGPGATEEPRGDGRGPGATG